MATVAKNTRSTTIVTGSTTAGPFSLGFRLFDTDGIKVYVGGVKRTDWTLSATFVDGYCDTATITFTTAISTGSTIIIDCALTPWRSADLVNGDQNIVYYQNIELGRMWSALAEVRRDVDRSVRGFSAIEPTPGIDMTQIGMAATYAGQASTSASAAAASAASAAAASNSLLRWKGPWVTATAYSPSDIVQINGSSYICVTAHTSGTFATDYSAAKWQDFALKGNAGAGTGDLLAANNLSELTDKPTARSILGLGSLATKATAAFTDLDPAAVITSSETIASNNNDTSIPTSAAVKAYADGVGFSAQQFMHVRDEKASGTDGGTFTSGSYLTRTLNTVKSNSISGASLSANQIILPAGTYYFEIHAPAFYVNLHKAKLYNVTDSADAIIGLIAQCGSSSGSAAVASHAVVMGRVTIAGTKTFEVRHRSSISKSINGFGMATNFGDIEVYTDVKIWKIS